MALDATDRRWLRWSLVAVWLGTALVSAIEWERQGRALLTAGGIAIA